MSKCSDEDMIIEYINVYQKHLNGWVSTVKSSITIEMFKNVKVSENFSAGLKNFLPKYKSLSLLIFLVQ